jgi:hypothetical protein
MRWFRFSQNLEVPYKYLRIRLSHPEASILNVFCPKIIRDFFKFSLFQDLQMTGNNPINKEKIFFFEVVFKDSFSKLMNFHNE